MITRPMIVKVNDLRAFATFSGSPPDISNLIPDRIINTTAMTAANMKAAFTIFFRKYGIQLSVPITCDAQVASDGKAEELAA
jgi:hypothetical protein